MSDDKEIIKGLCIANKMFQVAYENKQKEFKDMEDYAHDLEEQISKLNEKNLSLTEVSNYYKERIVGLNKSNKILRHKLNTYKNKT